MDTPLVRFDRVEFRHDGRPGRATPSGSPPPVLKDVTLSLNRGETVALVGRSGAGKSTLLRLVNRMLTPSAGRVTVDGRDTLEWDAIRLRRQVGYVIQDVGLFPHMTIAENVAVVPRLEGWPEARVAERTRELLDMVGLPAADFAARRPHQLSGGQRQRVGVARALAIDPPILLMDEPFGALDPVTRAEVRDEFTRLKKRLRTTVLVVTHDIAEAFALADRVGVLDAGELIALDTPPQVAASTDRRVRALIDALPPVRPSDVR
jgi:osmoprotectant transport system ATP-binding protein